MHEALIRSMSKTVYCVLSEILSTYYISADSFFDLWCLFLVLLAIIVSLIVALHVIHMSSNLNSWFLSTTSFAKWSKVYSDKRSGSESKQSEMHYPIDYLIIWVSSPQNCNNWIERQMIQQCSC